MTRGAAIACYTMFSLAPLLVLAVAIAGLAFGEEAVRSAVAEQLRALVGREGAEAVQAMVRGVGEEAARAPRLPALLSIVVLLVTASGVFAELQAALNAIWKAEPKAVTVSYLLRAGRSASAWWRRPASCCWSRCWPARRWRPSGPGWAGCCRRAAALLGRWVSGLLRPDRGPVRRDLQGAARPPAGVAGRDRGRGGHRPAVHPRQDADRLVHRRQRHGRATAPPARSWWCCCGSTTRRRSSCSAPSSPAPGPGWRAASRTRRSDS